MNNKTTDFKKGDTVRYSGAGRVETGTVTSTNQEYVFVSYIGFGNGIATKPGDLTKVWAMESNHTKTKITMKRYKVTFVYSGLWLHHDYVYAESTIEAMDIIQLSNPTARIRDAYLA